MSAQRDPYFWEKAALGLIPGVTRIQLRGYNAAISNATETVWVAGSTYARLTSAVVFEIVSASANDAAAGTGARTVEITTLDGNHELVTQTVTLNGTTAVDLTGTHIALQSARVLTVGSGGVPAGDLTIRVDGGGATQGTITTGGIGIGVSADFIYTIPANHIGLLRDINWTVTGATGTLAVNVVEINTAGCRRAISATSEGVTASSITVGRGTISHGAGYRIEEKTLIELRALASTGAGVMTAMGELFIFNKALNTFGL